MKRALLRTTTVVAAIAAVGCKSAPEAPSPANLTGPITTRRRAERRYFHLSCWLAPVLPLTPRRLHRPIALPLDPLVPVMKRRGRQLDFHLLEPGILPRRLVVVPVDNHGNRKSRVSHPIIQS